MICIALSDKENNHAKLAKQIWDTANGLLANFNLQSYEYSPPVLGPIFLRFAAKRGELLNTSTRSRRRPLVNQYAASPPERFLFLPVEARFDCLLSRLATENIRETACTSTRDIEKHKPQLICVLPETNLLTIGLLDTQIKKVAEMRATLDYDAFVSSSKDFLGAFAMSESSGGCALYTPIAIVKTIEEVIAPYQARIPSEH